MSIAVVDYRLPEAAATFSASLRETGFAVLTDHPIAETDIQALYSAWADFFASEEKHNYPFDEATHRGFVGMSRSETAKGSTIKDLKEFFHYYYGMALPSSLLTITENVFTQMNTLASTLLDWVQLALPADMAANLSMPLGEMITASPLTLLRILHYPPLPATIPAGAVRAAAHEDINLLTLLPAATAKGLQVLDMNDDWVDVPCAPGWMVVNIGDMLAEATNGYYRATSHRVTNPEGAAAQASRISSPLFLHPREEVVLSTRYTAGTYLQERLAELGLKK